MTPFELQKFARRFVSPGRTGRLLAASLFSFATVPVLFHFALYGGGWQSQVWIEEEFNQGTRLDRIVAQVVYGRGSDQSLWFDSERYELTGRQLAARQFERGLEKEVSKESSRDQSFEGLRDIIYDSGDREIRALLPSVYNLERRMTEGPRPAEPVYRSGLISDFAPITLFLEEQTGIPASVVLAQIIVESGWGASNVTILKNNVLGIGNCSGPDEFEVALRLGKYLRRIPVRCLQDTTAFQFRSIGDSIFYHAYILLQGVDNEAQYGELRTYIAENAQLRLAEPARYRDRVIALLSEGYHSDPSWYADYLGGLVRGLESGDIGDSGSARKVAKAF